MQKVVRSKCVEEGKRKREGGERRGREEGRRRGRETKGDEGGEGARTEEGHNTEEMERYQGDKVIAARCRAVVRWRSGM